MTDDPFEPLADARAAYDNGDYEDALRAVRAHVDRAGWSDRSMAAGEAMEIACLDALGLDDEAARRATAVMDTAAPHPHLVGTVLAELSCAGPAEALFRTLAETNPRDARAMVELGLLLDAQDRTDEAIAALVEAARRDPTLPDAPMHEARILAAGAEPESAVDAYRRYLELRPEDEPAWVSLAILESERGRIDAAYEAYRRGAAVSTDSVNLHYNWAITAARADDRDQLSESIAVLAESAPDDWRHAAARALLHELDGETWQGWEVCQEAMELVGGEEADPEAHAAAAEAVLAFLLRNDMTQQAGVIVDEIFEHALLTDGALDLIRQFEGRESGAARLYYVLVEGRVSDPEIISDLRDSYEEPEADFVYCRAYQVYAESDEDAGETALRYERRMGRGEDLRIDEIECLDEPEPAVLGVVLCSTMHIAPTDASMGFDDESDDDVGDESADRPGDESGDESGDEPDERAP